MTMEAEIRVVHLQVKEHQGITDKLGARKRQGRVPPRALEESMALLMP